MRDDHFHDQDVNIVNKELRLQNSQQWSSKSCQLVNNQSRTFNQSFIKSPDFYAASQTIKQCPVSSSKRAILSPFQFCDLLISILECQVQRLHCFVVLKCCFLWWSPFVTGVLKQFLLKLGYLNNDDHLFFAVILVVFFALRELQNS